jgi:hypothetical protein
VIGSQPSGSPNGRGRSPTTALPGAVKTLTPSRFADVDTAALELDGSAVGDGFDGGDVAGLIP